MKNREGITTKQKWAVVDKIIEMVEYRKKHNIKPYIQNDLEEYIYNTFGNK